MYKKYLLVLGPAWFSTYTNVACYLSTLLNPIAAMCFITLFRNELVPLLRFACDCKYLFKKCLFSGANTEPVAVTTTLESLLPLNDCQTEVCFLEFILKTLGFFYRTMAWFFGISLLKLSISRVDRS